MKKTHDGIRIWVADNNKIEIRFQSPSRDPHKVALLCSVMADNLGFNVVWQALSKTFQPDEIEKVLFELNKIRSSVYNKESGPLVPPYAVFNKKS